MSRDGQNVDQQLRALYNKSKRQSPATDVAQQRLHQVMDEAMSRTKTVPTAARISERYQGWSLLKVSALACFCLLISAPLVDLITQQLNIVAEKKLQLVDLPTEFESQNRALVPADQATHQTPLERVASLPEYQPNSLPNIRFLPITAIDESEKLVAFNQQVARFLNAHYQRLNESPSLYANRVSSGYLVKRDNRWFIQHCDQLQAPLSITAQTRHSLYSPLPDGIKEGQFVDVYQHDDSVLALLDNQHQHQCNEEH